MHKTMAMVAAALVVGAVLSSVAGAQPVGTTFRDCAGCPEMVVVPSGSFLMGSPESEEGRNDDEGPVHRVTMARPFAVGVYEVTFEEWDACVSGGGCGGYRPRGTTTTWLSELEWLMMAPGPQSGCHEYTSTSSRHPVINVSWEDAQGYVEWLSGKTGVEYRLLSESEWEYVARAGTTGPYHFGSSISPSQANYSESEMCGAALVGSYSANRFGLYDVHGNVWEWVEDCWNGDYYGAPADGSAWTSGNRYVWMLRGGSWINSPEYLRFAYRYIFDGYVGAGVTLDGRSQIAGLRVARTLTP